jgi:hypothetical protein
MRARNSIRLAARAGKLPRSTQSKYSMLFLKPSSNGTTGCHPSWRLASPMLRHLRVGSSWAS